MSTDLGVSPGADTRSQDIIEVPPLPPDALRVVVSRALGTVVVTVHGKLDEGGCELLDTMLTDLIEGQGNQVVAVDLARATDGPSTPPVFIAAACHALRRGTRFIVKEPPRATVEALASSEWGDFIEILPRAGVQ